MKPNLYNPLLSSTAALAFLLGAASSQAQVTLYAEYHLGEAGSLSGPTNLPQDSSGGAKHFPSHVGGATALVQTAGVSAAGSTAYLDTSMAGNQGFFFNNNALFTGLGTNNFAFGIYARGGTGATAAAAAGDVFQLGANTSNTYKLSLESTGWRASSANISFIGSTAAFATNTWVHLALIRNNGQTAFFVNGVQQGGNFATAPTIGAPYLSQAPGNGANANFDGHIDEARIVTFPAGEPTANILSVLTNTIVVPPGNNGTWVSTTDGLWSDDTKWLGAVIASDVDRTATFSASGGPIVVDLDSNRTIGNLVFSNANYTIGGTNVLTLSRIGTPGISVDTGLTATLDTNVAGTLGFEKTGLGTLVLSGPSNSYSGATTISGGTLQIGAGSTTGALASGNVTISSGAFLNFNRSNNVGTASNQQFSGAGTLVKNGAGDLVFNGTLNHTGAQGLASVVVNDGLIRTDFFGTWNSNLNLTVNGPGKFEMWNTSTTIANLSGDGTVQNTKFYGRTNTLTVAAGSFSGTITDSGITSGLPNTGAGDTRINLVKSGPGTLTLSGVTSYGGTTTITEGTLSLGNGTISTDLSDLGNVSIALGSTVDLNFTGSDVVGRLIIDGTTLPPGVYDSSVATPVEYRSFFTGTGSLTVLAQDGTWTSAVDGAWSNSDNWLAAVIATGADKSATFSAGSGPIAVTLDTGRIIGSLAFSGADYTLSGSNVLSLENSISVPSVSVSPAARTATLATTISGTGGLEKTGAGTLILSAASNNYIGTTTITEGIFQIAGGGRLGNGNYPSTISIANGAAFRYSSSASQILSGQILGDATDGGITKDTGNGDLTLTNTINSYSGATTISAGRIIITQASQLSNGSTSIVQSGTGQLFSNSTATISNPSSISTIGFNEGDARGTTLGAIRLNGGTLSGDVTLLGNSRIGGFSGIAGTQTNTISGKITGGFGIDFYGGQIVGNVAQVMVLTNPGNDYTGDTTILNGTFQTAVNLTGVSTTLRLGASGVIPDGASAGNVAFAIPHADNNNATLTLDLFGSNETINGLTVNPGIFNTQITNTAAATNSVLTIGANNTTSSFSGTVTNTGAGSTLSITKVGTGSLTLSGVNSYKGDTTVSDGTLTLNNPNASNDTSTVTIDTDAFLELPNAGTDTVGKLVIGITELGAGEYGNSSSVFPVTPLPQIIGNGTITVSPAGFSAWQTANGTNQTINLDHDNDGASNGIEFFLGGTTNTTGFTPVPSVIDTAGVLSVTWTKATTYTGTYGTDFVVETSATLASGSWLNQTATPTPGFTVTFPTANEVKYTFPTGTTNFARLKVTGP